MKTAIISASFFLLGAIVGSLAAGYFLNGIYERHYAILNAMELGSSAMQAEFIKQGDAQMVLDSIERNLPQHVIAVSQDPRSKGAMTVDTAMFAANRFYICTKTPIPAGIGDILNNVELSADACGEPEG